METLSIDLIHRCSININKQTKPRVYIVLGATLQASCADLSCEYGCKKDALDNYVCFCKTGYDLGADNKACEGKEHCHHLYCTSVNTSSGA